MSAQEACVFVTSSNHCVATCDLILNLVIACVGIFIVVINGLALFTLVTGTDLQEPTNYFLANLAAADALTGLLLIYDVFYNILQFKIYSECLVRTGLFICFTLASVLSLMALTLDRYFKVTRHLAYEATVTIRRVTICSVGVWVFSGAVGFMPFLGWATRDLFAICTFFRIMSHSYLLFLNAVFGLAFLLMTLVYIHLVLIARRHAAAIRAAEGPMTRGQGLSPVWRSVKTAFIIVGAFAVCWLPVGVWMLTVLVTDVAHMLPDDVSASEVFTYLLGLGVFNCIVNPVLYVTKIDVFRRRLAHVCCCPRPCLLAALRCPRKLSRSSRGSDTEVTEVPQLRTISALVDERK